MEIGSTKSINGSWPISPPEPIQEHAGASERAEGKDAVSTCSAGVSGFCRETVFFVFRFHDHCETTGAIGNVRAVGLNRAPVWLFITLPGCFLRDPPELFRVDFGFTKVFGQRSLPDGIASMRLVECEDFPIPQPLEMSG